MRLTCSSLAAAFALTVTPVLHAQTPPQPPKPGPEHQKLAYFAGRWKSVGEMKPGPMGPGGRMTATTTCEWFSGGFYLVCRGEGRSPAGPMHNLSILGYNTEHKRYTYYGIDNAGMGGDPAYGAIEGDTWTWEGEGVMGGQTVKARYVMKVVSPDSYTWTWNLSVAGGEWMTLGEGTETRVK
jgi:hypothetical protein